MPIWLHLLWNMGRRSVLTMAISPDFLRSGLSILAQPQRGRTLTTTMLSQTKDSSYDPLSTAILKNSGRGAVRASSTAGAAARAREDRHRTRNRRHRPENLRQFH